MLVQASVHGMDGAFVKQVFVQEDTTAGRILSELKSKEALADAGFCVLEKDVSLYKRGLGRVESLHLTTRQPVRIAVNRSTELLLGMAIQANVGHVEAEVWAWLRGERTSYGAQSAQRELSLEPGPLWCHFAY